MNHTPASYTYQFVAEWPAPSLYLPYYRWERREPEKTWRWWHDFLVRWTVRFRLRVPGRTLISAAINCIATGLNLVQRRTRKRRAYLHRLRNK